MTLQQRITQYKSTTSSPAFDATRSIISALQYREFEPVGADGMIPGEFYYVVTSGDLSEAVQNAPVLQDMTDEMREFAARVLKGDASPLNRNVPAMCMHVDRRSGAVLLHNMNYMPSQEKMDFYTRWLYKYESQYDASVDTEVEEPVYYDGDEDEFVSELCRMSMEYSVRPVLKPVLRGVFHVPKRRLPEMLLMDTRSTTGMDDEALYALRDRQLGYVLTATKTGERQARRRDADAQREKLATRLLRLRTYMRMTGLDPSRQQLVRWGSIMA